MSKVNILERGRSTFMSESLTLQKVANSLNNSFVELVAEVHGVKGRIVFTAIGKNQHIAKKIVGTLNSIGKPSLFMHATDAIHGDLGSLAEDDVVICMSKSGNSPEIKALIPLLKGLCSKLIGIGSDPDSYLARNTELYLHIPLDQEDCPHDLTPTNSTTAFLALGDALAMCILDLTKFTKDDFAKFHPGGAIGKKLYLRVAELFPNNERPAVSLTTSIRDTILEISQKRLGVAVVLEEEKIVGIITDGDLRRLFEKNDELKDLCARDAMSGIPKTIAKDSFATEALQVMRSNNITQLIVTENESYLGIVHIHDILKEGIV